MTTHENYFPRLFSRGQKIRAKSKNQPFRDVASIFCEFIKNRDSNDLPVGVRTKRPLINNDVRFSAVSPHLNEAFFRGLNQNNPLAADARALFLHPVVCLIARNKKRIESNSYFSSFFRTFFHFTFFSLRLVAFSCLRAAKAFGRTFDSRESSRLSSCQLISLLQLADLWIKFVETS